MEEKYNLEIQEKQQKIEAVKQNFEREVLKRIGDALIQELGKIIEKHNIEHGLQKNNYVNIAFPNFLKLMFNLLNKDNLLSETALLYIFLNFNILPEEYEEKYNKNIQKILKILNESSEIKNLIVTSSENSDDSQFLVEFQIPEKLNSQFNKLEENISNFLIYGVLAIIKWLGLLSPKYLPEYKIYEDYFQKYLIS
ncbi:MAG: hypothetical protein ACFFDN_51570 [Candidatus Hodarchaeota archaeon]